MCERNAIPRSQSTRPPQAEQPILNRDDNKPRTRKERVNIPSEKAPRKSSSQESEFNTQRMKAESNKEIV